MHTHILYIYCRSTFFLGLQRREAGASHHTWIIKTERTPLLFCRVSAQSVGKVETGDIVLKGGGNENKLVPQYRDEREVWCWDWVTEGEGCGTLDKGWEWDEMDLERIEGFLELLRKRIDILVWVIRLTNQLWPWGRLKRVSAVALPHVSFFSPLKNMLYAVCKTHISPFECISVCMCLYTKDTVNIAGRGIRVSEHFLQACQCVHV